MGFALITPDATRSGLTTVLVRELEAAAGSRASRRAWCQLDKNAVRGLYGDVGERDAEHYRRLETLITAGPSLALAWPLDVQALLGRQKGSAHPSIAPEGTIRSRYWCDNPMMNLVHCSDSSAAAAREFTLVSACEIQAPHLPGEELGTPLDAGTWAQHTTHNGALSLVRAIRADDVDAPPLPSLPSDAARDVFERVRRWLEHAAGICRRAREPVEAFLAGDVERVEAWHEKRDRQAWWERLAISATCRSMHRWRQASLPQVLEELRETVERWGLGEWAIGGSTAQWAHGLPVTPSDVDVRCSEATLDRLEDALGKTCSVEHTKGYRTRTCHTSIGGWDIEFSGDLLFDGGLRIGVDERACARRATGGVQSVEDLIVELVGMGRGVPHEDCSRAQRLSGLRQGSLDYEYLAQRLAAIGRTESDLLGPGTGRP